MQKSRTITLFKTKSKEEKTISEIRKKKAQIDKLKEEIVKMGRLVLKDGKLEKVEEQQQPQQPQEQEQTRAMPPPPLDVEYVKPHVQVEPPMYNEPAPEYQEPRMYREQPQEFREPPMFRGRQQQYQPPQDLTVNIVLTDGPVIQVKVSSDNAQGLLDAIGNSIETGAMLVIGTRAINPKYIVMYQYA